MSSRMICEKQIRKDVEISNHTLILSVTLNSEWRGSRTPQGSFARIAGHQAKFWTQGFLNVKQECYTYRLNVQSRWVINFIQRKEPHAHISINSPNKDPWCHVVTLTTLFTVACMIYGPLVLNLLHFVLLVPRFLKWLIDIWEICTTMKPSHSKHSGNKKTSEVIRGSEAYPCNSQSLHILNELPQFMWGWNIFTVFTKERSVLIITKSWTIISRNFWMIVQQTYKGLRNGIWIENIQNTIHVSHYAVISMDVTDEWLKLMVISSGLWVQISAWRPAVVAGFS